MHKRSRRMMGKRTRHQPIWSRLFVLAALCTSYCCRAQEDEDGIFDAIFSKENPPTLSPDADAAPPPTVAPSPPPAKPPSPEADATSIEFVGREGCQIARDIYCYETSQQEIDAYTNMTADEIEDSFAQSMRTMGVTYPPLVAGRTEYWTRNSTSDRRPGLTGYAAVDESREQFEVRALALGVVIKSISNVDSFYGTFDAVLKLYFFNVTEEPFGTMDDASRHVYKSTSKTTRKGSFFKLHEEDVPGAWDGGARTEEGESLHPDGICSSESMESMRPIPMEDFNLDLLRLPGLQNRIWPTAVEDSDGNLSFVEVVAAGFKFKPLNRRFVPLQTDVLDLFFEMKTTNLIHEDQKVVKHLLCLHPSYSGFASHVFGSDVDGGHSTSDALRMVPYIFYDRGEPWMKPDLPQFYYGVERQRSLVGNGSHLERVLALRIIADNPTSRGWFQVLPTLFLSLAAVANFVSTDPENVGPTTMVQALLSVNSLVSQNTRYIGLSTIMGQSLLLSYGINGLWILSVVAMLLINQSKDDKVETPSWYIRYQLKIFRYLRLATGSLCLLYIPLLCAYSIDEDSGNQTSEDWVWGLVVGIIIFLFAGRALLDIRKIRRKRKDAAVDSMNAFADISKLSSKPLEEWNQEEVLRWISIGRLHNASFFTEAKRGSIAEKLEAACLDGKMLCRYGSDVEQLVRLVGLPLGDAANLADELKFVGDVGIESDIREISSALVEAKNGGYA